MSLYKDRKELLFYDIEVFRYDIIIVFMNIEGEVEKIFHNDFRGVRELIEGRVLVGYNNYYYDDRILTKILQGQSIGRIKPVSDGIIKYKERHNVSSSIKSIDCFSQISPSKPSLKKIEGNLGVSIEESSVSFDINRKLNESEVKEIIEYCKYDVSMTIEVFKLREESYFKPKMLLLEMLGNDRAYRWNTTTISSNYLAPKPLKRWSTIRVDEDILKLAPEEALEMWEEISRSYKIPKKTIKVVREFGNDINFSIGGMHGFSKKGSFENVILWDASSMFPYIISQIGILGDSEENYKSMIKERMKIKNKDKVKAEALKVILNSVYGLLGNEYSTLRNEKARISVCVFGQCTMYELARRLSKYAEIININTDGIAFEPFDKSFDLNFIKEDWEKDFNLSLSEERFDKFIQSNVNVYVALRDDGKVVAKGIGVSNYSRDNLFNNNDARIVDIAAVEHLLFGKDVLQTIIDNVDKPRLYQYIISAGKSFKGTVDDKGNFYQKYNRVFPVRDSVEGVVLKKAYEDGRTVSYPNLQCNVRVFNKDVKEYKDFSSEVDVNHYYKRAMNIVSWFSN